MTATISEIAYAKINLALHVRAREADGYHRIETLFAFARHGDLLTAEPAEDLRLTVTGPFAAPLLENADNLVLKAAHALDRLHGGGHGAAITLDKRLPIASGIGGGSADAAAALRLLARLWNLPADDTCMMVIAQNLGADVPACILSMPVRGEGRGDQLQPILDDGLSGSPLLLVNPGVAVATGPIFSGWDGIDRGPLGRGAPMTVARSARNDLQQPAEQLAPVIQDVLAVLDRQKGTTLVRMSGSGATCFALFESEAACAAADRAIAAAHPAWWRLKTALR